MSTIKKHGIEAMKVLASSRLEPTFTLSAGEFILRRRRRRWLPNSFFFLITISILHTSPLYALPNDLSNHPELVWQVVETEHFRIIYYKGIERLAHKAAKIAEEAYLPITSALQVTIPQKTPIVIVDYNYIANGLASPLGNSIIIWTASEIEPTFASTTGGLTYLRAVIAHEFAHIATFYKVSSSPLPTGRLNALARIPTWFLEGIARDLGEEWDAHRDMLLRMAALENTLLSAQRMNAGFTGLGAIGSSLIYEQGHSLVKFIKKEYGEKSIARILELYRQEPLLSFDQAIFVALRVSFQELYDRSRREITVRYGHAAYGKRDLEKIASKITSVPGFAFSPRFSPSGDKIAFTSSQDNDYARLNLYVMDADGGKLKLLDEDVGSIISWSPDGRVVAYSKVGSYQGSLVSDIYVVDADGGGRRQITFGERAIHPDFSPDGTKIAFVREELGNKDIYVMNADGSSMRRLTHSEDFDQSYTPRWSRDGRRIAYSSFKLLGRENEGKRDIFIMDADGGAPVKATSSVGDDRMVSWSPDGELLFYTSDENGIPNLYAALPVGGSPTLRLTDAVGAAWEPDVSPDGRKIVLSGYSSQGFNIYVMDIDAEAVKIELMHKLNSASQVDENIIPYSFSAPDYNVKDGPYDSFMDIKPLLFLPAVFGSLSSASSELSGAYFLFLAGLFQDALEKHTLTFNTRYLGQSLSPAQGTWEFDFSGNYTVSIIDPTVGFDVSYLLYNNQGKRTVSIEDGGRRGEVEIKGEQDEVIRGGVTLSHPIDLLQSLEGSYSWERTSLRLDLSSGGGIAKSSSVSLVGGGWRYASLKPRVDSAVNPVGGRTASVSVETSHRAIGSDWGFVGGEAIYREFIELPFYRNTLQLGMRAGLREAIAGGAGREENEGGVRPFVLSGDDLFSVLIIANVLGRFQVAPQSVALRGLGEPLVGTRYALGNAEYRYPIFDKINLIFLNAIFLDSLFGDFFIDAGTTWIGDISRREFYLLDSDGNERKVQADKIEDMVKVGIGGGLRLQVAVAGKSTAIIRLEVAFEPAAGAKLRPFIGIEASF